jgi:hypothetical protein
MAMLGEASIAGEDLEATNVTLHLLEHFWTRAGDLVAAPSLSPKVGSRLPLRAAMNTTDLT